MENKKLNETAVINDEMLGDVSGGAYAQTQTTFNTALCDVCKNFVNKFEVVNYNNRRVCKDCMAKINK